MSLLPIDTIRSLQKNLDMVIEIYGFPVKLYLIKNAEIREQLAVYAETPETIYEPPVETKIWVVWNPETKWLRNMGIFVEDSLPIVAFVRSDHNVTRNSYFSVNMGYAVGSDQEEEFEFVDHLVQRGYDVPIVTAWKISPRRK